MITLFLNVDIFYATISELTTTLKTVIFCSVHYISQQQVNSKYVCPTFVGNMQIIVFIGITVNTIILCEFLFSVQGTLR